MRGSLAVLDDEVVAGGGTWRWSAGRRRRPGARAGGCSRGGNPKSDSTRAASTAGCVAPEGRIPSRYSMPLS
ncbi:unnamed protein product [Linum trigynum]|uniref:Uncharacterized protein n=1 Tax=Linum trigynum TaxID=586398 RepID=A0AAV2EAJ9_9ROSI